MIGGQDSPVGVVTRCDFEQFEISSGQDRWFFISTGWARSANRTRLGREKNCCSNRFATDAGERNHRRAAPLGAEQGEVLRVESGQKSASSQDAAGHLGALAATAVKSYFNHIEQNFLAVCNRKMGATNLAAQRR